MPVLLDRPRVERFRAVVARRFGLGFDDGKVPFLEEILGRRAEAAGLGVGPYLDRLESGDPPAELRALAGELTVAETYFFRNADHFTAFAEAVVPRLLERREGTLRVLSAGCASGEEPYSLAIQILEKVPAAAGRIEIVGIDLNPASIAKAAKGRYTAWSLRETDPAPRGRWFREEGREFVLDPAVRRLVAFEERNLLAEDPVFWRPGAFQAAFCRNVIMYFTPEGARAVVDRLASSLVPRGFLFLGHAETLRGLPGRGLRDAPFPPRPFVASGRGPFLRPGRVRAGARPFRPRGPRPDPPLRRRLRPGGADAVLPGGAEEGAGFFITVQRVAASPI